MSKISLDIESSDAFELIAILQCFINDVSHNMPEAPITYSRMVRIHNDLREQVIDKVSEKEVDIIMEEYKNEPPL